MGSNKRLVTVGTLIGGIAVAVGIYVTSRVTRATGLASSSPESSHAEPSQPNDADSPADENEKKWQSRLTEMQFKVTRKKATEPPFSGKYWDHKGTGVYTCVCCGSPLFYSLAKFDSNTGWPSFYQPADESKIETQVDFSLFTQRTEVICRTCKAHLGHVFEDGPPPTGLRYCINSAALDFQENHAITKATEDKKKSETGLSKPF